MDSLLETYASSDEEEQPPPAQRIQQVKPCKSELEAGEEKDEDFLPKATSKRGGIFDSFPPPKSSLFNSLPPPKSQSSAMPQSEIEHRKEANEHDQQIDRNSKPKSLPTSLFSSLPAPKSSSSVSSSSSASKRIVQFKPPTITNPYSGSLDDADEDSDQGEEERKRNRSKESISTSSAASFLSSIPPPRHSATLGGLPSSSGMSRRSVLETKAPSSNVSTVNSPHSDAFTNPDVVYFNNQSSDTNYAYSNWSLESEKHTHNNGNGATPNVGADVTSDLRHLRDQPREIYHHSASLGGENNAFYSAYGAVSTDVNGVSTDYEAADCSYAHEQHLEHTSYGGGYGDYGNNTQYENNWGNSTALPGKRGRKDIPPEIVEVTQDELMKNRPREDQVKFTGIAFGPAYQPASTKGKPTKLHKRKHQIGSLYFDMKQKEMELAERRSKGFLTKAQTQAKYGW